MPRGLRRFVSASTICHPDVSREVPAPRGLEQDAEKFDFPLDFGWRSCFSAAITGFFSEPALAAAVILLLGNYFFGNLPGLNSMIPPAPSHTCGPCRRSPDPNLPVRAPTPASSPHFLLF